MNLGIEDHMTLETPTANPHKKNVKTTAESFVDCKDP